jgi:hypothetical protein
MFTPTLPSIERKVKWPLFVETHGFVEIGSFFPNRKKYFKADQLNNKQSMLGEND